MNRLPIRPPTAGSRATRRRAPQESAARTPGAERRLRLGRRGHGALVVVATFGVLARLFAEPDSWLHTLGALLIMLWLPIALSGFMRFSDWYFGDRKRPRQFAADAPAVHHLRVEATFGNEIAFEPGAGEALQCLFLLGSHGFTARLLRPAGSLPPPGEATVIDAQFLAPEVALRRFAPGTEFHIVVGRDAIGSGKVLAALTPP